MFTDLCNHLVTKHQAVFCLTQIYYSALFSVSAAEAKKLFESGGHKPRTRSSRDTSRKNKNGTDKRR